MVAMVSGSSVGLSLSSLTTLARLVNQGVAGQGRNGEQSYVNIATGNLILQDFDDGLVSHGGGVSALRTYNSQGNFTDDNGDNWSNGIYSQQIQVVGTLNSAGSTIVRTDRDGAKATYSYDAGSQSYITSDGAGANDSVRYDSANAHLVWTDGSTGSKQIYDAAGTGRLLSTVDTEGNSTVYSYTSTGLLSSVVDSTGESVFYDYAGNNLTQIRTQYLNNGVTQTSTSVRYAYDAQNRLSQVTVDLSPQDNQITDGNVYQTSYTYDGASDRVKTINQTDGTSLSFSYVQVGSAFKVASVQDGLANTTSYSYDTVNQRTTVIDPLGLRTVYNYDGAGRLTQVTAPAVNGVAQSNSFIYSSNGDLLEAIDGLGNAIQMQYDASGNQTLQRDASGNTITRTYDLRNQLLTETTYLVPDPDGAGSGQPSVPQTTRYIYDAAQKNLLRFTISAEGRVTEFRYNAYGEQTSTIKYDASTYAVSNLTSTQSPSESDMAVWVAAQDKTSLSRADMTYDARGQLLTATAWAKTDTSGNGVSDGAESVQHYVYDQAGRLLKSIDALGGVTQFSYDGLGRLLVSTDSLGRSTINSYDDAGNKTTQTLANGLATTSSYDKNGRLIGVAQSAGGQSFAGTSYVYDADNRLLMAKDATGVSTWMLYDDAGRHVGDVDANGRLTEYIYNKDNQVINTVVYATAISTALLSDSSGNPKNLALALVRPAASNADRKTWNLYDNAGRLYKTIDEQGHVSEFSYDGNSQVVAVKDYALSIDTSSLPAEPLASDISPGFSVANRVTRNFYDKDGLLVGTLDAEGYLTEYQYDDIGQKTSTIRYANSTVYNSRATGTLDQLRPLSTSSDQVTLSLLNHKGQVAGQIDAEGYLTENVYDLAGNLQQSVRYANKVTSAASANSNVSSVRPVSSSEDASVTNVYDALNRIVETRNSEGTITRYAYDNVGNLIQTSTAADTSEVRTVAARYDVQGRLVGQLSAEGSALLTGNETQVQLDAIWSQYGIGYSYDAAGRKISATDQNGNRTLYYYDADDHLTQVINALGEVTENQYNVLGQLSASVKIAARISVSGLTGGLETAPLLTRLAAARNVAADTRTSFTYNTTGTVSSSTDALGNAQQWTYDAFGEVVSHTQSISSGRLVTELSTYDRLGSETSDTLDAGGINAVTSFIYDAFGRPISATDANGNIRQTTYDRLGRVITIAGPDGSSANTTYDAFGRTLSQSDGLGLVTTYSYNKQARSVSVTTPENITVVTKRSRLGQVQSVTDGNGNVTSFSYDKNGNLLSTTSPLTTTSDQYDHAGRLIQTTDANGIVTTLAYDAANRVLTRTVDPSGLALTTRYTYDGKGQEISVTDPNGTVTQFVYDLKGQLLGQTVDAAGLNLVSSFSYDGAGRTLTVTSAGGTLTRYGYDNLGRRISQQTDPSGLNLSTAYGYDKNGNVTSRTDPNGNITRYVYDSKNRLTATVDPLGHLSRTEYDANGNVLRTIDYANAISTAGLGNSVTIAQVQARIVAALGRDLIVDRVYDRNGRLTDTVTEMQDGSGSVQSYIYDANGNVLQRIAYANRIDLSTWTRGTRPTPVADGIHDQRSVTFYDQLNRATYSVDGAGDVSAQTFDGNGNVVQRIAYAVPVASVSLTSQASLVSALAGVADATRDYRVRNIYDAANRVTWTANGVGAVSQFVYDKDGNVVKEIDYANTVSANALPSTVSVSAADRITDIFWDADNRKVLQVDALGNAFATVYDRNGNVTQTTAYALAVVAPTTSVISSTTAIAELSADSVNDRVSHFSYDAANRQIFSVDAQGAVTEFSYDASGNAVQTHGYAKPISISGMSAVASTADIRSRILVDAANDRIAAKVFDADNHVTYSVDAQGFVTHVEYDSFGNIIRTTQYTDAITAPAPVNESAITSRLTPEPATDRVNTFAYDVRGKLTSSTDPLGAAESYTYNGLGQKTSYTNKLGAVWQYEYDAAGRLVTETAPQVQMTTVAADANGNLVVSAGQSGAAALVTHIKYDAMGNVVARTEAAGRPEERTTLYAYDAVGHQIKTIYPAVALYNPSADNLAANGAYGLAARTEAVQTLYSAVSYDAFGDAVTNRDVAGNLSYKAYDKLGRVSYDVDALGYVTGYSYNAWGQTTRLVRFAQQTSLTGGSPATLNQVTVASAVNAAGLDHGSDRVLLSEYDRVGRLVKVTEPQTFVYDSTGASGDQYFIAGKTTRNLYNAFGDLTQVAVLKNPVSNTWNYTTNYYDKDGREIAVVDALGYLTTQTFDAAGNVTAHTEFANAIQTWNALAPSVSAPQAAPSADDRTTLYGYDKNNNKTSETRVAVEFSNYSDGTSTRGNVVTSYGYDAVGNLTRTTDANGSSTYSYYDALGRVTAVAAPTRISAVDGGALTPLTLFQRDAYGNVVVQINYSNSTASSSAFTALPGVATASLSQFDSLGHLVETTDANGVSHYNSYDARGNLAKTWQAATGNNGVTNTLFEAYQYDALGRRIHVIDPGSSGSPGLIDTQSTYNAFGEVTGSGVNGSAQVYYDYDNEGNVWRTNSGDGVDKVSLRDLQGNVTANILSAGIGRANLGLRTFNSIDQIAALTDVRRTDIAYDALGHVVQQAGPERLDQQGAVSVQQNFTQATVSSSSVPSFDESGAVLYWVGTNTLTLNWSSLAALGSGDIKVDIQYASQVYMVHVGGGGITGTDEAGNPVYARDESGNIIGTDVQAGGAPLSRETIVTSEQGATGVTLSWTENGTSGTQGGISRVTQLTVYKKDVNGYWQPVIVQANLGYNGNSIEVTAPSDPSTNVQLQLRTAGTAGDAGWTSVGLTNFGDSLRFDASVLTAGNYEYRVLTTPNGGLTSITNTGSLGLTAPALAVISEPMAFAGAAGGVYTWQTPGSSVEQIFRIRPAGSTGGWDSRQVVSEGNGLDGVDLSNLAAGNYEYELLWIHAGEGVPFAHATGQVTEVGGVPPRWVPPVGQPNIAGVTVQAGVTSNQFYVDESGNEIFYFDESGNVAGAVNTSVIQWPFYGTAAVDTFQYRAVGTTAWQTITPVIRRSGYDESSGLMGYRQVAIGSLPPGTYEFELIDENSSGFNAHASGVFTISAQGAGHYETQQVAVQVPITITPADPSNYIIGWTGHGAVYGPPVVVGYDEGGSPIFGQGYAQSVTYDESSGVTTYGPVYAVPYTAYRTELQTTTVPVQVAVGQDPVLVRDESGNVVYETVYQTQYLTRTVPVYATYYDGPRTVWYTVPIQVPRVYADESGQLQYARDESGNIIYDQVDDLRSTVVYDQPRNVQIGTAEESYPVPVAVQQPVYARDESGNIVYQTRYATQYQTQTVSVQVPYTYTPPDPAQYMISAHSGSPIYGPPVAYGYGENGMPVVGIGYTMRGDGVMIAQPYTIMQTQYQSQQVWVAGSTPPATLTLTTVPYQPGYTIPGTTAQFSGSSTTPPGTTAISQNPALGAPLGIVPGVVASQASAALPVINQVYGPFNLALPGDLYSAVLAGSPLSYSATLADGTALPSWLSIDSATGQFSGVPTDKFVGALALKVTAAGANNLSASSIINLPLNLVALRPVVTQQLPAQIATAGDQLHIVVPAGMFDESVAGDALTYSATLADGSALPSWLHVDPSTGTISGVASNSDAGALSVKLTATDRGGLSASSSFALQVNANYRAATPAVTNGSISVSSGVAFRLALPAGLFADSVAGNALTYSATLSDGSALPAWLNFNPSTNQFTGEALDSNIGSAALLITATDQAGNKASTTFTVQVAANATRAGLIETVKTVPDAVNPSIQRKSEVDRFDPLSGDMLELEKWDPATGHMIEFDQWDAVTGQKVSLQKFDATTGKATEIHTWDANTGREIEYTGLDAVTGRKLEVHQWDAVTGEKTLLELFDSSTGVMVQQNNWDPVTLQQMAYTGWTPAGNLTEIDKWDAATGTKLLFQTFDGSNGKPLELHQMDPVTGMEVGYTQWDSQTGKIIKFVQYDAIASNPLTYERFDATSGRLLEIDTWDQASGRLISATHWDATTGKQVELDQWDPATGTKILLETFDATSGKILQALKWDGATGAQTVYDTWNPVTGNPTEVNRYALNGQKTLLEKYSASTGKLIERYTWDASSGIMTEAAIWDSATGKQTELNQWNKDNGQITLYERFDASNGNITLLYAWDAVTGNVVENSTWDAASGRQLEIDKWDPTTFHKVLYERFDVATGNASQIYIWDAQTGAGINLPTWTSSILGQNISTTSGSDWIRPTVYQKTDRWGNVIEISDPRSAYWKTVYKYNADNELILQVQPDSDGNATLNSPVTQIYYDKLGREVAIRDADGHVNGNVYDAAGNLVQERHADGGVVNYSYDGFGNKVRTVDAIGNVIGFAYDNLHHLLQTSRGVVNLYTVNGANNLQWLGAQMITQTSTYDQAGRQLTQTNGNGETIRYAYDLRGNVIQTTQAMGENTFDAYDAEGHKISETDANGNVATWSYDYFGQLHAHTDIGGAVYSYGYDNARQLIGVTDTRGKNVTYQYDAAGQLTTTTDYGIGQITDYAYDLAGNHVEERTWQTGAIYQDNHLAYDALGRLRWVGDGRVMVNYTYDNVGNRTRVFTHVINAADQTQDSDRWYAYDAMNRQTVVDGLNAAGAVGPGQGHRVTYDLNGNRLSDTSWGTHVAVSGGYNEIYGYDEAGNPLRDESGNIIYRTIPAVYSPYQGETTESYSYDALGRLITVVRDGVQLDARYYDGADRLLQTGPSGALAQGFVNALNGGTDGTGSTTKISRYDADGRLLHQRVLNSDNSAKYDVDYTSYDQLANVLQYNVVNHEDSDRVSQYSYSMQRSETYQVASTYVNSNGIAGSSTNHYDADDNLSTITDSTKPANNRTFVNDAQGHTLWMTQDGYVERQLVVNGEVLGRYGSAVDADNPMDQNGTPIFVDRADFNFGYQPVTATSDSGPSMVVVSTGDTLQSIARAAYGDTQLWYLIAEANGISDSSDLHIGQTLSIPSRVNSIHNNSSTFKPYDPSKIVGSTTPNLPVPQQSDDDGGGCGGLGQVITIVVAVVVAYYTGLQIEGLLGQVVGGAVGSAAGQLTGEALGVQQGFNWDAVALSAISAGVSDGVGVNAGGATSELVTIAEKGAIANALTQGIAIATGLQNGFDWKGVVASAAGAAVGSEVGGLQDNPNGFAERLTRGIAAGATASVLRGGHVGVVQVAADAFGNALASRIGGQIEQASQQEQQLTFAQDMANRRASNYWNASDTVDDWDSPVMGGGDNMNSSTSSITLNAENTDNQSLINANNLATMPDYYGNSVDGQSYVAGRGDSISKILGTSDPQAVGNFMRANGLTNSNLVAGNNYFIPDSTDAYGNSSGLGQSTLNTDNARIALIAQQQALAAQSSMMSPEDAGKLYMQYGGRSSETTGPVSFHTSSTSIAVPAYDAMGNATGMQTEIDDTGSTMSYGDQMAHVGEVAIGVAKGAVNGAPKMVMGTASLLWQGAQMQGMIEGGVDPSTAYQVASQSTRDWSTGEVLSYTNPEQRLGGYVGEFASPSVYAKGAQLGIAGLRTLGPAVDAMAYNFVQRSGGVLNIVEDTGVSSAGPVTGIDVAQNAIPARLYHYTNETGMNGILDSQTMNPSLKALNPNDVRYGNGQYLSDIPPGTMTPAQLSRTFINNPFQGARYTNFVEIDTNGLNIVQGRPGVYVVPNETPLDLAGRVTNSGKVVGK